jgi:DNA-binding NarL/FixJ family response regulator
MTITIVIVDDDAAFRDILRFRLEQEADLEVLAAVENGRAAIAAVRKHLPDIVIMDVNMPELGGIDTTRALIFEAPEAKVIALSGSCEDETRRGILAAGAVAFVHKDHASEDLLPAIRAAAGRLPPAVSESD